MNAYITGVNLTERVNEYMSKTKKNISDIAKEINYSRSTLSQYLNGKYQSDATELEEKLMEFIEGIDEDVKTNVKIKESRDFFVSEDAGSILAIAKACHDEAALGLVVGRSGYGKTKSLKKYAEIDRVLYIECDASMACRDLVEAIEKTIGLPEGYGTLSKRMNVVKDFFNINKGYLLIVDEADKLISKDTIKKLEILRNLYDQAKLGILVVGEPKLESLIRELDPRFANRIDFYYSLKGLAREEVAIYLDGFEMTPQALEELVARATNHHTGCFRLFDRTLRNVSRLVCDERKITLQIIHQASSMMLL